jgi:hypothetical protein
MTKRVADMTPEELARHREYHRLASARWFTSNRERQHINCASWYANNREGVRAKQAVAYATDPTPTFERQLKRLYGITLAEFNTLWEATDGLCDLCHRPMLDHGQKAISRTIDHDHSKTGFDSIRGIIHLSCNRKLADVERGRRSPTQDEKDYLRWKL